MKTKSNTTFTRLKTVVLKYYWLASIPLVIYAFILTKSSQEDINNHLKMTVGIVYDSKQIHKQYSKRRYKYKFHYEENIYYGSSVAYITEGVQNGKFYKIAFSSKNPEHSKMIFDFEYVQKIIYDNNRTITDTTYVMKNQEFQNKINNVIKTYEYKNDSLIDSR